VIAEGRFALVKTTLVDFPGRVAAAVFLPGCHLRCPYCHNPDFVEPSRFNLPGVLSCTFEDFQAFLEKRRNVLGGVVFSGGEALLHPLLPDLIGLVNSCALGVKLDTAGLLPQKLENVLNRFKIDYVAMDLKTSPHRYEELGWKANDGTTVGELWDRGLNTLENAEIDFEVRTTMVPGLVDYGVLDELRPWAERADLWAWQSYGQGDTLNPEWGSLSAMDEEQIRKWVTRLKSNVRIEIR
jgi:pyruvate formate lyase activating enzyme